MMRPNLAAAISTLEEKQYFIRFRQMRILVQRVFQAWVRVGGEEISRTKAGLLVLVGITHDDNPDVVDHMVTKILNMRLWEKDGKGWNGSVIDEKGDIMVVSQFTLYGILKGNKPDFHASMDAEKARELFHYLVNKLKETYQAERIQTGKFQALMEVGSIINGPVTINYEKSSIDMPKKKVFKPPQKKEKQEQQKEGEQGKNAEGEDKKQEKNIQSQQGMQTPQPFTDSQK